MLFSLLVLGGLLSQPSALAPSFSTEPTEAGREAGAARREARRARRAHRANGPEVYKGRTAQISRVVTESGLPDGQVSEEEVASIPKKSDSYAKSADRKRTN